MNINDYKKVTNRLEPDERCRNEVLEMSKRENKIKQNINEKEFEEKVTGVEVRHGNSAMKYISIAAAFVLVAGGLGTTGVLLHKNGKNAAQISETEIEESTSNDIVEEEKIESTDTAVEYDYAAIAEELTDHYIESINILEYGNVEYDINDSITFYTYDSTDEAWSESYGGERTFYRVTDERFKNCQDIYEFYKKSLASSAKGHFDGPVYTDSFEDAYSIDSGSSIISWLGGDVSEYDLGSKIDLYLNDGGPYDEKAYAINNSCYLDYKGKLYVSDDFNFSYFYTTEPEITETGEDSFTIRRYLKPPYMENENIKYGDEKIFNVILDNGEWKIDHIEWGAQPEYMSAIAIQSYLEKMPEYNDINIDCKDIVTPLEILDYDKVTHICKVHAILKDVNGNDAIDITAETNVGTEENPDVISADITRLNEYDGTLKRDSVIWAKNHPDEN